MKKRISKLIAATGAAGVLALGSFGLASASNGADDPPGQHQEHAGGASHHHKRHHHRRHHPRHHQQRQGQGIATAGNGATHVEPGEHKGGYGEVEAGDNHGGRHGGHGADD